MLDCPFPSSVLVGTVQLARLMYEVEHRARHALHRKKYSVSSNDFWYIDEYHKMIRWGIIIHGGIDGYCRLVTFLQASSNNNADTMFQAFNSGISEYGFPHRVQMNKVAKMYK